MTFAVFSCQLFLHEQFLLKRLGGWWLVCTCPNDDHVRLHSMKINRIFHPNPHAQHVHMSSNVTNVTRRCLRFTCHKMAKKNVWTKRPGEERRGENLEDSHHLQRSSSNSYGGTGDGLGMASVPATVFFFLSRTQTRIVPIVFCLNKGYPYKCMWTIVPF